MRSDSHSRKITAGSGGLIKVGKTGGMADQLESYLSEKKTELKVQQTDPIPLVLSS